MKNIVHVVEDVVGLLFNIVLGILLLVCLPLSLIVAGVVLAWNGWSVALKVLQADWVWPHWPWRIFALGGAFAITAFGAVIVIGVPIETWRWWKKSGR